jgi:hypothetical protein
VSDDGTAGDFEKQFIHAGAHTDAFAGSDEDGGVHSSKFKVRSPKSKAKNADAESPD